MLIWRLACILIDNAFKSNTIKFCKNVDFDATFAIFCAPYLDEMIIFGLVKFST